MSNRTYSHKSHPSQAYHRPHNHRHGAIDPTLITTERGIWAVKWSLIGLGATALFQLIIVFFSGSVALLADTIHNIADAGTAIPLWIAFALARRPPSRRFTYGLGRVEDVAGVFIVLTILFSAVLAGYESINRLLRPQSVAHLWAVAVASLIGFAGNEMVAVFRIWLLFNPSVGSPSHLCTASDNSTIAWKPTNVHHANTRWRVVALLQRLAHWNWDSDLTQFSSIRRT